ncbi:MAG: glycosyltransferase, partial [Chitinophagales bacterium]
YVVKYINRSNKKVLYLDPFFDESAGTHYRVAKWANIISENDILVSVKGVFTKESFDKYLNKTGSLVLFQLKFILSRFWHILISPFYKTVIVRRTILLYNEYGNGNFMERLLLSLHPNVILDFDDYMQILNYENIPYSLYGRLLLENRKKFDNNLSLYNRFIVGSEFLKTQVLKHNSRVQLKNIIVVPTCVDYASYTSKEYNCEKEEITFGWIGSDSNQQYLDFIIPVLNKISKTNKINLLVISGNEYLNDKAEFTINNIKWSLETEKDAILKIDIGLMPLSNTLMDKGKCGFKLIQYMGLGVIGVASGVTINNEIIDDEWNGFIVKDENDWEDVLLNVLKRKTDWSLIGKRARKKIKLKYSFDYYHQDYVSFVTSYISNYSFKDKLKKALRYILHFGFGIWGAWLFEKTRDKKKLLPGITAVISAKNEEVSIMLSLRSLIGFADQIVCIDNGSEDDTLKLMHDFKEKFNSICDITVLSMPESLLGECRDKGLELTKHLWHLRWDADMVFKTSGSESAAQLRKLALSTNRPMAFQLPRVNLYGDFFHTSKFYDIIDRGEPFLMRYCDKIKYVEDGRFDIVYLPPYYIIKRITNCYIFHCDGIKANLRLIFRNCYFDWRQKFNSRDNLERQEILNFPDFKKEWELRRYGTNDELSLIYRHQKEYLLHYKRYDPDTYSELPDILIEHQASGLFRFEILYKDGHPCQRADARDPRIQNYTPSSEDLAFNPISFLKDVMSESDLNRIKIEAQCAE